MGSGVVRVIFWLDEARILGGGRVRQIPSPSGVGGETGSTAQEDLKSINSYNVGAGKTIRVWFFHSCIPRPSLVLSALFSLGHLRGWMKPISHKQENGGHRNAFVSKRAPTRHPPPTHTHTPCSVLLIKEKQTPQVMEFCASVSNIGKCKGLGYFVTETSNGETKHLTQSWRIQVSLCWPAQRT